MLPFVFADLFSGWHRLQGHLLVILKVLDSFEMTVLHGFQALLELKDNNKSRL